MYKGHITRKMKRSRQTPIIPACKHSGIKNNYKQITTITKHRQVLLEKRFIIRYRELIFIFLYLDILILVIYKVFRFSYVFGLIFLIQDFTISKLS